MRYYIQWLEQWINRGLDLIYPRSAGCPICRLPICSCASTILLNYSRQLTCRRCGKFLAKPGICSECMGRGTSFPERVWALAPYEGSLRDALHRFKYQGEKRIGKFFAELLLAGPGNELGEPDLIIPVPLHPSKLRQRGYNQAQILAEQLAKGLNIEVKSDVLNRVTLTQPQSGLSRQARLANLNNAFRLSKPLEVKGKSILLVDDIITTGSTLEACGIVLRQAGIAGLTGICLAAGRQAE